MATKQSIYIFYFQTSKQIVNIDKIKNYYLKISIKINFHIAFIISKWWVWLSNYSTILSRFFANNNFSHICCCFPFGKRVSIKALIVQQIVVIFFSFFLSVLSHLSILIIIQNSTFTCLSEMARKNVVIIELKFELKSSVYTLF